MTTKPQKLSSLRLGTIFSEFSRQDASNELPSVKFGSLGVSEGHLHKKHIYLFFKFK